MSSSNDGRHPGIARHGRLLSMVGYPGLDRDYRREVSTLPFSDTDPAVAVGLTGGSLGGVMGPRYRMWHLVQSEAPDQDIVAAFYMTEDALRGDVRVWEVLTHKLGAAPDVYVERLRKETTP